jgi:hypothetical protein
LRCSIIGETQKPQHTSSSLFIPVSHADAAAVLKAKVPYTHRTRARKVREIFKSFSNFRQSFLLGSIATALNVSKTNGSGSENGAPPITTIRGDYMTAFLDPPPDSRQDFSSYPFISSALTISH